jgi:hypothetical protein
VQLFSFYNMIVAKVQGGGEREERGGKMPVFALFVMSQPLNISVSDPPTMTTCF